MSLLRFSASAARRGSARERHDPPDRGRARAPAPDQAKYLATFAYVARAARERHLAIDATETAEMERIVHRIAGLPGAEAALRRADRGRVRRANLGGTQDYLVTRQFRMIATREQRADLLACLYAVAAADGTIQSEESAEIVKIGEGARLHSPRSANSLRSEYRDKLANFSVERGGGAASRRARRRPRGRRSARAARRSRRDTSRDPRCRWAVP